MRNTLNFKKTMLQLTSKLCNKVLRASSFPQSYPQDLSIISKALYLSALVH
jgi:hypothetical protein